MKQNQPWTKEEIEKIQDNFSKGARLKEIAKTLGRSESSVNKALSRFGARRTRENTSYINWNPHADYCKGKLPPIIKYKTIRSKKQETPLSQKKISRTQRLQDTPWVPMGDIIHYIKSKGAMIETFHPDEGGRPNAYSEARYFLNKTPCTALKVVLFANKLRTEEGKPTFLAKEVTW